MMLTVLSPIANHLWQSTLYAAAGVDLKSRIVRLMTQRAAGWLSPTSKLLLATVAIANAPAVHAQLRTAANGNTPTPSFEVASVRPDHSDQSFNSRMTASRFVMERWRVKDLIEYSYDVKEAQVLGIPKWIDSERYDIEAKVEDSVAAKEQDLPDDQRTSLMRLRVQALLANRFGLRVHHSVKTMPVLALVPSSGGPEFFEGKALSRPDSDTDGRQVNLRMDGRQWVLSFEDAPLSYLIRVLSGQPETAGRILVDQTGLNGDYTFKLQWEGQTLTAAPSAGSESSSASLFTALQEQLGLKLESQKGPVEVLVIDHVEKPSEN
jgi:bla regulator protein blaR1